MEGRGDPQYHNNYDDLDRKAHLRGTPTPRLELWKSSECSNNSSKEEVMMNLVNISALIVVAMGFDKELPFEQTGEECVYHPLGF